MARKAKLEVAYDWANAMFTVVNNMALVTNNEDLKKRIDYIATRWVLGDYEEAVWATKRIAADVLKAGYVALDTNAVRGVFPGIFKKEVE